MTLAPAISTPSVGAALEDARRRLREAAFQPPGREAILLMTHVLGLGEAAVLAHPERALASAESERFERLIQRRLTGEPTAYLLGEREFYGRPYAVDRRVLIPRPETEHLIDAALALDLAAKPRILDIGTGSGVIALTLALEIAGSRVVATDSSPAALAVARSNRRRWGLTERVTLLATDLTAGLRVDDFDLVVSNPPYIAPADAEDLSIEITRFEPPAALFSPPDGLGAVRQILGQLTPLRRHCWLLLEIGAGQSSPTAEAARAAPFEPAEFLDDYAGIPRVAVLRRQ